MVAPAQHHATVRAIIEADDEQNVYRRRSRARLLACMPRIELTLVIGQYAQAWHLQDARKATLTATVLAWRDHWPAVLPLPHPSPRNNLWLKRNAWFDGEVLPSLKNRMREVLQ